MIQSVEQRLVQLDICAVKLAEIRKQLYENYGNAQEEIKKVIAAKIEMIKKRETELLIELVKINYKKNEEISEQQVIVHNAIGACLKIIKNNGVVPAELFENSIIDYDHDVRIEFDADLTEYSNKIANFGTIKVGNKCSQNSKNVGKTLPSELEIYEDDSMWLLSKKTSHAVATTPETSHEVGTVKGWLSRLPANHTALNIDNIDLSLFATETEIANFDSDVSETTSSFEVVTENVQQLITKNETKESSKRIDNVLSDKFIENLKRPMKEWLMNVSKSSKQSELPPAPVPDHFRENLYQPSSSKNDLTKGYQFVDVMKNVQMSDDSRWIKNDNHSDIETTFSDSQTIVDQQVEKYEKQDIDNFEYIEENCLIENLSKLFERGMVEITTSKEPTVNETDLELWRNIINRNQQNRKWLQ